MTLAPPIRWVQPSTDPTAAIEVARSGDWSELPVIERASGALELTASSGAFVGGLASRRAPGTTLARLRRGMSLEAPHGLVRGIARVLEGGRRDGPDLAPAPPAKANRRGAAAAGFSIDGVSAERDPVTGSSTGTDETEPADKAPGIDEQGASGGQAEAIRFAAPDLPRPRIVQAVTRAGPTAARATTALTRVAEAAAPVSPPSGLVSPAPLESGRSVARTAPDQVVEAATPTFALPAPARRDAATPDAVLPDFRPRRMRGMSQPPPVPAESEPGAAPVAVPPGEPAAHDDEPAAVPPREPAEYNDEAAAVPPREPAAYDDGPAAVAEPGPAAQRALSRAGLVPSVARPVAAAVPTETASSVTEARLPARPVGTASTTSAPDVQPEAPTAEPAADAEAPNALGGSAGPESAAQTSPAQTLAAQTAAVPAPAVHIALNPALVSSSREFDSDATPSSQPAVYTAPETPLPTVRNEPVDAAAVATPERVGEADAAGDRASAEPNKPAPDSVHPAPRARPSRPAMPADGEQHTTPEPSTRELGPGQRGSTAPVQRQATTPNAKAREHGVGDAAAGARAPVVASSLGGSPVPDARQDVHTGGDPHTAPEPSKQERVPTQGAATTAVVRRRATLHEHSADEAAAVLREPVADSPVADSLVPAPVMREQAPAAATPARSGLPQTRTPSDRDTAPEPSMRERGPAQRASTPASVERQPTTTPAKPRAHGAGEAPAKLHTQVVVSPIVDSSLPAPHERAPSLSQSRQLSRVPLPTRVPDPAVHPSAPAPSEAGEAASAHADRASRPVGAAGANAAAPPLQPRFQGAGAAEHSQQESRAAGTAERPAVAAPEPGLARTGTAPAAAARGDRRRGSRSEAPEAPVQRSVELVAEKRQVTASAESADGPNPVAPSRALTARRPGLDVHAALSGVRVSRGNVAPAVSVQRVHEHGGGVRSQGAPTGDGANPIVDVLPARLPGLDAQRALSRPAPHGSLQLAPTPAAASPDSDGAAPAAPSPPPTAIVAHPTPPPPSAVQRITNHGAPEDAERERLSEAPDDELEELADRLYDHIRNRFRAELLIDRERAGLLADRY